MFHYKNSTIYRCIQILPKNDQLKIFAILAIQIFLGVLDLGGIALAGVLGGLAISGVSAKQPGNRVLEVLKLLHLENFTLQKQAIILGLVISLLMVSKTLISILFARRTVFFLSRKGAVLSSLLVSKLLGQPLQKVQEKSLQQTMYSLTAGVNSITVGILGTTVFLVADISLLIIISIGLIFVDKVVAISTFVIFAAIGFTLFKLLNVRARTLGIKQSELSIKSAEKIMEVLSSYRELVVKNRRHYYSQIIGNQQLALANNTAEMSFMPQIGKYVIEITVVLGSLFISAIQFFMQDAAHSIAVLSVFLAASTRIAPAVLRIQQGALSIKGSIGTANPTLELINNLKNVSEIAAENNNFTINHLNFEPNIEISNVTLTYSNKSRAALDKVSIRIPKGSLVAIVGPSGAGKTSLVDVLLGILEPDSGVIKISGFEPLAAIAKWPGAISYLPQDVVITNGSIRDNVTFGYDPKNVNEELVWKALSFAKLDQFVKSLPYKLETQVGDRGTQLSGGQRQRLGIARAILTQPLLLVMDEATSALDGETEQGITEALNQLHNQITIVMIAHRLSTVRDADIVFYFDQGKLIARGTFDDVRKKVPNFERQAKLMGLN